MRSRRGRKERTVVGWEEGEGGKEKGDRVGDKILDWQI